MAVAGAVWAMPCIKISGSPMRARAKPVRGDVAARPGLESRILRCSKDVHREDC